jgi:hypothetical protein
VEGKAMPALWKNLNILIYASNTPFAGSANIQDGITIDLSQLNEITVSEDKTKVTVSTGDR